MFWVISVYFNIRNTLPKSGTFLLGHPVYTNILYIANIVVFLTAFAIRVGLLSCSATDICEASLQVSFSGNVNRSRQINVGKSDH